MNNRNSQKDVLTLCLRLCLEPSDSHSLDTLDVLERYRPAWEAAAGGMDYDQALALLPKQDGPDSGVPREPTAAMTFAGLAAHPDLGVTGIWQAMYDAAPSEAGAERASLPGGWDAATWGAWLRDRGSSFDPHVQGPLFNALADWIERSYATDRREG